MAANSQVACADVAEQLRRAIRGEVAICVHPDSWTWDETYCGDVLFVVGDWKIAFFSDCDELDYCSDVDTPDGRHAEFDDWWTECDAEPTMLLVPDELAALDRLLRVAKR